MNSIVYTLILNLFVIIGIMFLLWIVSLKLTNASIVDPFWGMGFFIVMALVLAGVVSTLWMQPLMALTYGLLELVLTPLTLILR